MQYLLKIIGLKWFFCLQINTKVFYKVIVFLDVCNQACPKYSNNKFVIYLQYLKEKMKTEVDFLLFLSAIWLCHGQIWAIINGKASLTRC